jgi:hypothetical protein
MIDAAREIDRMKYKELTESDLEVDEKKVMGRIIDMWSLGSPEDPYQFSTESEVLKYAKKDGLSEERAREILKTLEDHGLIHRVEENGKAYLKYKAEAAHIVKELQKTTYVNSREHFKPPHH